MEERLPASDDSATNPPPPASSLETYVVQVPRDQIYRVPPPEHALKIEEHTRNSENQEANRQSRISSIAIPIVLISVLAVIAIITVRATVYRPTAPEFTVTGIQGKGLANGRSPEFKITIQARSRNTRLSASYKGAGETALLFKNKEIGQGRIGSAAVEEGTGGVAELAMVLAGNAAAMTPEMKKSLTDDKEKSMEVNVELTVEMKSWMRNQSMDMMISCDFRVRNSLMNVTQISFQECKKL
ncbi:hypothetical protein ACS0TY_028711 [Phlomoides rotata]